MRSAGSELSLEGSEFKFTTCENTAVTKLGWEEKWESTIHSPEVFHSMTRGSGKGLSLEQGKNKNLCRLAHSLEEVQMSSSQHCYAFYWMQNIHIHQFCKRCGNWDVSHFNTFCWWLWGLFGVLLQSASLPLCTECHRCYREAQSPTKVIFVVVMECAYALYWFLLHMKHPCIFWDVGLGI